MRLLHRLRFAGCDATCCTCELHTLAMRSLARASDRSRGGVSAPLPRAGASPRPAGAAVDAINTPRSAPAA